MWLSLNRLQDSYSCDMSAEKHVEQASSQFVLPIRSLIANISRNDIFTSMLMTLLKALHNSAGQVHNKHKEMNINVFMW